MDDYFLFSPRGFTKAVTLDEITFDELVMRLVRGHRSRAGDETVIVVKFALEFAPVLSAIDAEIPNRFSM